ncbi:hypothetical protein [Streptomyces rubrogriseus]|uniref:hypothetical protein n=1 Tax=Streptomyces rubrogriseus TaxID=194673 RepID=UPI00365E2160
MIVALAVAACSGAAFVVCERRSPSLMLDLTLFRSAALTSSALVVMISSLGPDRLFFFVLSLYGAIPATIPP